MRLLCCVPFCGINSEQKFYFPPCKNLAQEWINNLGDWGRRHNAVQYFRDKNICGLHFHADQFLEPDRKKLKKDAVPTIFPSLPVYHTTPSCSSFQQYSQASTLSPSLCVVPDSSLESTSHTPCYNQNSSVGRQKNISVLTEKQTDNLCKVGSTNNLSTGVGKLKQVCESNKNPNSLLIKVNETRGQAKNPSNLLTEFSGVSASLSQPSAFVTLQDQTQSTMMNLSAIMSKLNKIHAAAKEEIVWSKIGPSNTSKLPLHKQLLLNRLRRKQALLFNKLKKKYRYIMLKLWSKCNGQKNYYPCILAAWILIEHYSTLQRTFFLLLKLFWHRSGDNSD